MRSFPVDASDLELFLGLGSRLHESDPSWIPPLQAAQARDLVGAGAFGGYGELQMILCEDHGEVVGRLAAIHNPRLPGVGQIGYVELTNDPDVLESLLKVAVPWLRKRGATEVWGPMDGGAHKAHRLMTRGFDRPPFLFEPRNPPYLPMMFEAQGFEAFHRWHSYELSTDQISEIRDRLGRAAERTLRSHTIVPFDLSDPAIMPRLHAILDRVWSGHVGYAPMELDEFLENYAGIVAITRSQYLGVVMNDKDEDIAIGLCYPDWSEQVRALQGDASGWASWDLATLPRRLVMHTVAVVPEERGGGPAVAIVNHAGQHIVADGFDDVVVALVVEEFSLFRRFTEPTREYALYRKRI